MESDAALREASEDDAGELAVLLRRTRAPYLPVLHTPAEDLASLRRVLRDDEVWMAETPERIVGFIAFSPARIDHLCVDEAYRGEGIGSTLLAWALRDDEPRDVFAFERNTSAIAFYEERGFAIVERTDGTLREERESGVRMRRA